MNTLLGVLVGVGLYHMVRAEIAAKKMDRTFELGCDSDAAAQAADCEGNPVPKDQQARANGIAQ